MNESSRVSRLRAKYEQEELERINRLTGLKFDTVPVSLLSQQDENNGLAESLLGNALSLWKEDMPQEASSRT